MPSNVTSHVPPETRPNVISHIAQETLTPSLRHTQGVLVNGTPLHICSKYTTLTVVADLPPHGSKNMVSGTSGVPRNVAPDASRALGVSIIGREVVSDASVGPSDVGPVMRRHDLSRSPHHQNLDDGRSSPRFSTNFLLGDTDADNMDFDDMDVDSTDNDTEDDSTTAIGRISDANTAMIKAGYLEVQKVAKGVASKTGLSVSQVFKQWSLGDRRKHVRLNYWNLYSKYFKDNEKQELARLTYSELRHH